MPSSVLNHAAKAEYGFSSKGTVISFLSFDPHKNVLWSLDNLIIPFSTAFIPMFLILRLSSCANS